MIAVDGIRERYRVVAGEADVAVSLPIHDFSVEARWIRIESDHGIQAVFGQFRRTQDGDVVNVLRQTHTALHAHLPDTSGLEAKLDQSRRHQCG